MQLRIGHLTFDVRAVEDCTDASGSALLGLCNESDSTIQVRRDQRGNAFNSTLVHEILHGVLLAHGHPWATDEAEETIRNLEGPLCALLRDNPVFIRRLTRALQQNRAVSLKDL